MERRTESARWLIARFLPCALFALKVSTATSSVGRTLLVPTPYAIKMALVEAAFTASWSYEECDRLLRALVGVPVRIAPPDRAVVSHTFLKVRQEPKTPDPERPYISSIAYREFVFHRGEWRWAFNLRENDHWLDAAMIGLLPYVRYIGKRGSFIQFDRVEWTTELDAAFTQPANVEVLTLPNRAHIAPLDDLGPEADLATLSPYSPKTARAGRHRVFVNTIVPLGVVNTGPGFTEYGAN
jgi:hypothetical protein